MNTIHRKPENITIDSAVDVPKTDYVLLGNMNVYKTTLFDRLYGATDLQRF